MLNRVPHCSECEKCKSIIMIGSITRRYGCYKDTDSNEYGEIIGKLGVDNPPKTSPKWCPKRKDIYEKYDNLVI